MVVMRGQNDDELADFVRLTRDDAVNVRFIEYMPFDGNVWSDSKMVGYRDMQQTIEAAFPQGLQRLVDPKVALVIGFLSPVVCTCMLRTCVSVHRCYSVLGAL